MSKITGLLLTNLRCHGHAIYGYLERAGWCSDFDFEIQQVCEAEAVA
jgi:hypothetical protein